MMVSCTMMRMLGGMKFLRMLTERFDSAITAITAIDITIAVSIFVVTARAEQMPST